MENDKIIISAGNSMEAVFLGDSTALTVKFLNKEYLGLQLTSTKETWEEKIKDLQEQADKKQIPIKIKITNG